jgi:uncharacterized protein (UPF0248 family)
VRCNNDIGFLGSLSFNSRSGRCGKCEKEVQQTLNYFRQTFITFCQDGVLSPKEWVELQDIGQQYGLNWQEALSFVRGDALNYLERVLAFAAADGVITNEEEIYILNWRTALQLPEMLVRPLLDRLQYLKMITNIKRGNLPVINPRFHLESDEICHLDMEATYYKVNAKSITHIPGRLVATNKKLHFLSTSGGSEIPWKRIMRIERDRRGLYLELSTKKGNGQYDVTDPMLAEAVFTTLVKISKRELVPSSNEVSRHIPHDVRTAVWQRDSGKCVQCRETSYLEFDHIIPFSKGGASTIGNVQLLCRKCNLAKGGRI